MQKMKPEQKYLSHVASYHCESKKYDIFWVFTACPIKPSIEPQVYIVLPALSPVFGVVDDLTTPLFLVPRPLATLPILLDLWTTGGSSTRAASQITPPWPSCCPE
jgi:hypothetical protein